MEFIPQKHTLSCHQIAVVNYKDGGVKPAVYVYMYINYKDGGVKPVVLKWKSTFNDTKTVTMAFGKGEAH